MDTTTSFNYFHENPRAKSYLKNGLITMIPIVYAIIGAVTWSSCSAAYHRIIFANGFVLIWSAIELVTRHRPISYVMIELQILVVMWAVQVTNNSDPMKDALEPQGNFFLMISFVFFTIALWVHTFAIGILGLIYGSLYLYYLANPQLIRRPLSGLNEQEIENLPIRKFDSEEMNDPATPGLAKECVICLENFKHQEEVTALPSCTHAFHKGCIAEWVKKRPHCPYCRNNIRDSLNSPTTIAPSPRNDNVDSPNIFRQSERQYQIPVNETVSDQRFNVDRQELLAYGELQEL